MATNKITVIFPECLPAPSQGYRVFYRPTGGSVYRQSDLFLHPPVVIFDTNDPAGTTYEGYIQSDCGNNKYGANPPTFNTPGLITGVIQFQCSDESCTVNGDLVFNITFDNPTPPNLKLLFGAIIHSLPSGIRYYVGNQLFTPPVGTLPWNFYTIHGVAIPFAMNIPEGVTSFSLPFASGPQIWQDGFEGDIYAKWLCHGIGYPPPFPSCSTTLEEVFIKIASPANYSVYFTDPDPGVTIHNLS
jgi:hypothetical protein